MFRGLKDCFSLLPLYAHNMGTAIYFLGRWFITPYSRINAILPTKGTIIDIGCGEGILSSLLALRGKERRVIGFDYDGGRIRTAERATRGKISNVEFFAADALSYAFDKVVAVTMIDVLHHLANYDQQEQLIRAISDRLSTGALFVIREAGKEDVVKGRFAYWGDVHILYRGDKIYFRTTAEWKTLLEKYHFDVDILNTNYLSPLSSYLLIARKK